MPARFSLIFSGGFRRDLEDLPARVHDEVLEAVSVLGVNPKGPHAKIKKLKAKGIGQWRLEVWPYRVRYDVVGLEVHLYRVRHRREIPRLTRAEGAVSYLGSIATKGSRFLGSGLSVPGGTAVISSTTLSLNGVGTLTWRPCSET